MRVYSTHVGSFPLEFSRESVRRAFVDMVNIGVDYPPFPQLRGFVDMYLRPLVELEAVHERSGRYYVRSPEDLSKSMLKRIKVELPEVEVVCELMRGAKVAGARAPITGPFTLSSQVLVEGRGDQLRGSLTSDVELVREFFVEYVRCFVDYVVSRGFNLVVIDEPMLSVMVGSKSILYGYRADDVISVLNGVTRGVRSAMCGVHVCGRISPLLRQILLQVESVKVLDHEFRAEPSNLNVYSREDLERYDKYIAAGIVSSRSLEVESLNDVLSLALKLYDRFGGRLMFLKPDCGFRELRGLVSPDVGYEISIKKLEVVVSATRRLNEKILERHRHARS